METAHHTSLLRPAERERERVGQKKVDLNIVACFIGRSFAKKFNVKNQFLSD